MKTTSSARRTASLLPRACVAGAIASLLPLAAHAGPTIEFGEEGSLTFTYALQAWAQHKSFTSPTDDSSSTDFFLRRNRLTFSGQFNDNIGFYAQLEAGNDSKLGQDNKSVYYRDAYVTFDYRDDFRFIVGRFKNTFSRENLEACLEPLTMDRAEVISYTPFAGSRDTGVAMWGNLLDAKLQYRVMVADGRDDEYAAKDNMRFTGRVHWSFWDPEYDYGYLGTYLGTRKVLTVGAAYDYQPDVAYANFPARTDIQDYSAWTVDAFMEYPTASGVYTASAAYFDYDTGNAYNESPDPNLPINSTLKGWYAKAGYMLPNKVGPGRLQFFGRYEDSDYGATIANTEYYDQNWMSVGAHYYLDGQRLKVSFEYAKIEFDNEYPNNPALQDYNQATLGLQFIF